MHKTGFDWQARFLLKKLSFPLLYLFPAVLLATGSPKIKIDETVHDFGVIYRGETVEHIFVIRNQGNDTLHINNVRSSCGCTAAMMDKRTIPPGGTAELKTSFDAGRYQGQVKKMVSIYSDDMESPTTTLYIQADVRVDLEVVPAQIFFTGLKEGEKIERKITLKNLSNRPITVKEIASTVPDIKFELSRLTIEPGKSVDLNLFVDEVTKGMKLSGNLIIYNTSKQNEIKVPVYGGQIR
ncbi:MAG TPA: DUF1573 domain-containing protein [archaeon]|nr:DUF1573 domain-containing protein [archaeon]